MPPQAVVFPLHCIVCPKRPTFSDVSHLLTHVGSKAHLSHVFKLNISTGSTPEAAERANAYRHWYDNNSIDDLMAARMHDKNRKKVKVRSRGEPTATKPSLTSAYPWQDPALHSSIYHGQQFIQHSTPDPLPIDSLLFHSPASEGISDRPFSVKHVNPPDAAPRMHLWSTHTPHAFTAPPLENGFRVDSDDTVSWGTGSEETADAIVTNNVVKLKGIVWPGMAAFDSATEDMKRMRNQKKHFSVVSKLDRNSRRVQPIENITDGLEYLVKSRIIDGKADIDSPGPSPALLHVASISSLDGPSSFTAGAESTSPPVVGGWDNCKPRVPLLDGSLRKTRRAIPVFHDGQSDEQREPSTLLLTSQFTLGEDLTARVDAKRKRPQDTRALRQIPATNNVFDQGVSLGLPPSTASQYCVPGQYNHTIPKQPPVPDFWSSWGYDLSNYPAQSIHDVTAPSPFELCPTAGESPRDSLIDTSQEKGPELELFVDSNMTETPYDMPDTTAMHLNR